MRLSFLALLLAAGCHPSPGSEPVVVLGARGLSGYHVLAGANTAIPGGDIGYLVTANGQGGYALYWTDTAGSPAVFTGTVTTDRGFDPNGTTKVDGSENVVFTAVDRIDFSGVPGSGLQGIQFVSQTDPVYFDLLVDQSHQSFGIYFTGAHSGLVEDSFYNPVAFTSP